MRKLIAILLVLSLLLGLSAACAEGYAAGDYSWLDDLTINQLKELDAEIHKRIPYEGEVTATKSEPDDSLLLGLWECVHPNTKVPKNSSFYGHEYRYTLEFYIAGTGMFEIFDIEKNKTSMKVTTTYEMKDATTLLITRAQGVGGMTTEAYTLSEDETGPVLIDASDETYIYRKVRQ